MHDCVHIDRACSSGTNISLLDNSYRIDIKAFSQLISDGPEQLQEIEDGVRGAMRETDYQNHKQSP